MPFAYASMLVSTSPITVSLGIYRKARSAPAMRYLALLLWLLAAPTLTFAHDVPVQIADCACDSACYTDEVSRVSCFGGKLAFRAGGFPDQAHPLMVGITGSNQQFPRPHAYRFEIQLSPRLSGRPTDTEPGAIGVAVNGVPIFDPSTQGPKQAGTGKPISAAEAGELDTCGGHAGRGDDYHYHRAPNCLIEELGAAAVDGQARPIGFAADGFPIHALGWFDRGNEIEHDLDQCRGTTDTTGRYFYNVEAGGDMAVLNCFSGTPRGFTRDSWDKRRDASGAEITGIPLALTVSQSQTFNSGGNICSVLAGQTGEVELLQNGQPTRKRGISGVLFYCSPRCYGHFVEAKGNYRGRPLVFEAVTAGCPASLDVAQSNGFLSYRP